MITSVEIAFKIQIHCHAEGYAMNHAFANALQAAFPTLMSMPEEEFDNAVYKLLDGDNFTIRTRHK